jgi:prepilin-type N-terminal cleavage/methylation domain-containing protein
MEILKSQTKPVRNAGFALIETMVAIVILAVGLLGAAALLAQLTGTSSTSRYMSTEALLASEKLDDLNRLPDQDAAILIPAGDSIGSLTADTTQNVIAPDGTPETIDYFDTVAISSGNGSIAETVSSKDAGGNTVFTTTTHAPDGNITIIGPVATPPVGAGDTLLFKRRWIIEQNVPGLPPESRRITVLVTLPDVRGVVNFQTSMVR